MIRRYELTDQEWEQIAHLLPTEKNSKPGRPSRDNRLMMNAMIWIARSGAPQREEEIEVGGAENTHNLSQVELMRIEVKFDYETDYQDYPFIPVGTQAVLLNSNTMMIGAWGKVLLAYGIQQILRLS